MSSRFQPKRKATVRRYAVGLGEEECEDDEDPEMPAAKDAFDDLEIEGLCWDAIF